jgi:hypothetical protein
LVGVGKKLGGRDAIFAVGPEVGDNQLSDWDDTEAFD